jgi:hypothetical protein
VPEPEPTSSATLPHIYLTAEEAAQFTRRGLRAIQQLTSQRAIPHRKQPGTRRVLYPARELEQWIDGADLETIELAGGGRVVKPVALPLQRAA